LIDQAKIYIKSGRGGNGCVAFHREKFVPRGGPDGGDGGRGGNVIMVAENRVRTLLKFRYERKFVATNGGDGSGNQCSGKKGKDIKITVPVGTVVYIEGEEEPIVDLNKPGMKAILASGGRGGRGNQHYATPSRQTPRFAENGEPGEELNLKLELKLLADVGLIGLPNAGKSTFLSRVTAAAPKIADYPFTTLEPQLGVAKDGSGYTFVIADLPGLISGAAQGRGQGLDFLRHAERSRVILHIVDISGGFAGELDATESFLTINGELDQYGEKISALPTIVALNKEDVYADEEMVNKFIDLLDREGIPHYMISAATGEGVDALLYAMTAILKESDEEEDEFKEAETVIIRPRRRELEISLIDEGIWEVTGTAVERLISMTNMDNEEAVYRLQGQLERRGVFAMLKERGIQNGDTVQIGNAQLEYSE